MEIKHKFSDIATGLEYEVRFVFEGGIVEIYPPDGDDEPMRLYANGGVLEIHPDPSDDTIIQICDLGEEEDDTASDYWSNCPICGFGTHLAACIMPGTESHRCQNPDCGQLTTRPALDWIPYDPNWTPARYGLFDDEDEADGQDL